MTSYSVLCELVLKNIFTRNKLKGSSLKVKNGVKLWPGSEGRLGSGRGSGRDVCVCGGGEAGGGGGGGGGIDSKIPLNKK